MQQLKKFITNKYLIFLYGTIFVILLWWIISLIFNTTIVPDPISTFRLAGEYLTEAYTYKSIGKSLLRLVIGFSIAFIIAFVLGLIVSDNEKMYHFFTPLMTFFKAIPTAALVFLFIVLSSQENSPILAVIVIAIPILYEAVVAGLKSCSNEMLDAAKIDGANKISMLLKIQLPNSYSYIVVGLLSAFSLSFKVEIMGEVISGSTESGLGSLIKGMQSSDPSNMEPIFAYSLIAVVLMLLITIITHYLNERIKKSR